MGLVNRTKGERSKLSPFLWCFLFLGILLSAFAGEESSDTFFKAGVLSAIRTGEFHRRAFFLYVLFSRLAYMTGIIILSTTIWRRFFLLLQPLLLCLGLGAWLGTAIVSYGIKGILLVVAAAFPHLPIYGVILYLLLMVLWEGIYFDRQFFIVMCILYFAAIIGCLLEGYVNPILVGRVLEML